MDTEKFYPIREFDFNNIAVADFSEKDIILVKEFIEITRWVQEIGQLFQVFSYHRENLQTTYDLNNLDTIIRRRTYLSEYGDLIEINALIGSLLSAGNTLVGSLIACDNAVLGKQDTRKTLEDYNSEVYDRSFAYKLLTRLRDFSQHGHLPVSINEDRFCFDISQIAKTPHYSHNKALRNEIDQIEGAFVKSIETQALLTFTLNVAEYALSVIDIYHSFWENLRSTYYAICNSIQELFDAHPEYVTHDNSDYEGFCFFQESGDDYCHCFYVYADPIQVFAQMAEEAKGQYEEEKHACDYLKSST